MNLSLNLSVAIPENIETKNALIANADYTESLGSDTLSYLYIDTVEQVAQRSAYVRVKQECKHILSFMSKSGIDFLLIPHEA